MKYGHRLRRWAEHVETGKPSTLASDHPAALTARTRYLKQATHASKMPSLLKSGHNNKKIGGMVVKGAWKDMPIYTLTLEERATCPRTCGHWLDCYGNQMHWSKRIQAGPALETGLRGELAMYQHLHPGGFVVRLHVLGDFYSVAYVTLWRAWLTAFPALRAFGYTAWQPGTKIGDAVAALRDEQWDRFAVRTSDGPLEAYATLSIDDESQARAAIVCPAQTNKSECCSTCSLCWATSRNIAFLRH